MKKIFLLLVIVLYPIVGFSNENVDSNITIDEYKTDVYFANGILTDEGNATANTLLLRNAIKKDRYDGKSIEMDKYIDKVKEAYNETHFAGLGDLVESLAQKIGIQGHIDDMASFFSHFSLLISETSHSRNLETQINAYKTSIQSGHKVLVVAHSQGNLFTYEAKTKLIFETKRGWMSDYFKVVSIASPAMFSIPGDTPLISWDNDLVAWLGIYNSEMVENPIRKIDWEPMRKEVGLTLRDKKPILNYARKGQVGQWSGTDWRSYEDLFGKFDSTVHAFTFYMGEDLAEGKILNPFDGSKLHTDEAKDQIMDAIERQLNTLESQPSQWEKVRDIGCLCKDKRIKITHKHDTSLDVLITNDPFEFNEEGKIYRADVGDHAEYVRANNGDQSIDGVFTVEEVDNNEICYVLKDDQANEIGNIKGIKDISSPPSGFFTAQLRWSEPGVRLQLGNDLMNESVNECGMNAVGSGELALEDVYPRLYPVNVTADGYQELNDVDFSDSVKLEVKAHNTKYMNTFLVTKAYQYPNLGFSGHVADIIVTQTDPREPQSFEMIFSGGGGYSSSGGHRSGGGYRGDNALCKPMGNCGCIPCEYSIVAYLNQVRLGPISGAKVRLYKANEEDDINREILYEGNTFTSSKIDEAGIISLPVPYPGQTTFSEEEQILIDKISGYEGDFILEVSGGFDIDKDDDFTVDSTFTQVNSKLHMILSKKNLLANDYKVNILTEISYQVSKDLLGDNYDKERLQTRLDDIAKRVFIEKLYDGNEEELGRNDIFYWIPSVHKNWLIKAYESTLSPIVNKIYKGENITDDAYHYVYDTPVSQTVPLLVKQSIKVDENISSSTMIGSIDVLSEGNSSIVFYQLRGDGNETFNIENNGNIYLSEDKTLDYEEKNLYYMQLIAVNSEGESRPVTLSIIVTNSIDAPEYKSFNGGILTENASSGDLVATVYFDEGAAPIERIELEGEDKALFTIDLKGTILVSDEASFDYEIDKTAKITVQAFNSYGASTLVPMTIIVTDAVDIPIVQQLDITLAENATVNQVVGNLTILSNDPPLEMDLIGDGNENFTIDLNGTIRVAQGANIDYESRANYVLQVEARNIQGVSHSGIVIIRIYDVADVPLLKRTVLHVMEKSPVGTVVGDIDIEHHGNSPILSFSLYSEGSENFSIDDQGRVTIVNDTLDRNSVISFRIYASATNNDGESVLSEVLIYVDTQRPILASLNIAMYEGASAGTLIGTVPLISSSTPISAVRLEGENNEKFTIDLDLTIKVAEGVELDYEIEQNYVLTVIATNSIGESDAKTVYIRVVNVGDTIQIQGFTTRMYYDIPLDSVIGIASVVALNGHTVDHFELSGEGSENFHVEGSGIVKLVQNDNLGQSLPQFHLALVALDQNNVKSNQVYLDITVVPKIPPLLDATDITIEENATVVGKISILDKGTHAITAFIAFGNESKKFTIDVNGMIALAEGYSLDYEKNYTYTFQALAESNAGSSEKVDITIHVSNVIDNVPVLATPLESNIDENVAVGTKVTAIEVNGNNLDENTVDSYTIVSGNLNDTFLISGSGVIKIAVELDYNEVQNYTLKIIASNIAGDSIPIDVVVNVHKEILKPFLIAKKTASDVEQYDEFGSVVAVSGNLILVGAPYENEKGSYAGAAYLFEKDENANLNEIAKLTASDGRSYEDFGKSVAISANLILVSSDTGVYLFEKDANNNVIERAKFFTQYSDAIAINGNLITVGVGGDDGVSSNAGAAYIFKKEIDGSVKEVVKLTASDAESSDYFGSAVAMRDELVVVGAPQEDEKGSSAGAVYLFGKDVNGSFVEIKKLTASDGENYDRFGSAVAINTDQIVVGAPFEDEKGVNAGAAYLFAKGADGTVVELEKLTAIDGDTDDNFGASVSISEDLIGIGSAYNDEKDTNAGTVYLYQRDINASVLALKKLIAPDGEYYDSFGTSVSLSDALIVVGAPYRHVKGYQTGSMYIFDTKPFQKVYVYGDNNVEIDVKEEYTGSVYAIDAASPDGVLTYTLDSTYATMQDNNFTLTTKLDFEDPQDENADNKYHASVTLSDISGHEAIVNIDVNILDSAALEIAKKVATDGKNNDKFGRSVAVSGDFIVVGSYGAAYLFKKDVSGNVQELKKLIAFDGKPSSNFGHSVAIHNDLIAVSAPLDDDKGSRAGAVYLYEKDRDDNVFDLVKISASDAESGDYFGASVSISHDQILIGASVEDEKGTDAGAAYLFQKDANGTVLELAKLTASDGTQNDYFGTSVSIDGEFMVVGAYRENQKGSYSGAAYLFKKDASGTVIELEKISASNGVSYDYFGESVSISGDYFIVGATGHVRGMAYLYHIDASDNVLEAGRITASDGEEYDDFGVSVAIDNDLIVVGASQKNEKGTNSGVTYLFNKDNNDFISEVEKLSASDGSYEDYFGTSVAIEGNNIVVGAPYENEKGSRAGAIYLYDKMPGL